MLLNRCKYRFGAKLLVLNHLKVSVYSIVYGKAYTSIQLIDKGVGCIFIDSL